ncbi:hypothetical protein [Amycolatopsis sp. DG1A-15b]|uniref:hypothetical protein n=1 Tax=Amycolatopsis sp. DG1A-15b TaxID=3052846 RepID=UPI00255BFF05|nr:hypothetical protein [Amycolatopsis sp. DG1A-15b]WIX90326.1 hypothetical protein QRY02_07795 [Amycolatopsis sp. DG1A-15b]
MSELKLALEVPRWTWQCYTEHLGLVLGLSSVASVQRLIVVNWTAQIPHGAALASEVVVLAARIALVVAVWRIAMRGQALRLSAGRAFARNHWRSLLWQGAFLGAAYLAFEVLAEGTLSKLLPESARQTYLAILLLLKNPTVIALTFLWWIGVVRQVFRTKPALVACTASTP